MKFTNEWFEVHRESWDRWLRPWLRAREPVTILEIGSYEGRSACWFLDEVVRHHERSSLMCVDPWKEASALDCFNANVAEVPGSYRAYRMPSSAFFRDVANEGDCIDCVYIDGDHSVGGVRDDTLGALRLAKPDGVIIWDDYHCNTTGHVGVRRDDSWAPCAQDNVRAGVLWALGDDVGLVEQIDAAAVLWMEKL